ncbi:group III truncated hemoglobin [Niabella drilacis]|uniref:Hemoglobin n=1 Tax=Niabella drilacis (strain DSM 25811 / CCM 8410 / CCUG 62505 / LMG 26954 / E90) TaxID=1285928 RepID=A0A1G6II80_NIADE|nr:group III truncated hemoglobin [Niabella drilacis]SDC06164.1 hemoglobin [Niabella drilacis]
MNPDIATRKDIEKVVDLFYQKVSSDAVIGFFFTEVTPVNWEQHLPVMYTFWENVLFYTGEYEGNPIATHRRIHEQYATRPEHFQRWIALLDDSVNQYFAGPNAEKMKQHARAIAMVMMQKIAF